MTEDGDMILEEIRTGILDNWYAVELKSSVLGYEISEDMLLNVMHESHHWRFYRMLESTLMESDAMDRYFENTSLVKSMLSMDGEVYFERDFKARKKRIVSMLKELDVRNPRYLLKYFLHGDKTANTDPYYRLFLDIIERTRIRSEKSEVFGKYLSRLEDRYKESRLMDQMCS